MKGRSTSGLSRSGSATAASQKADQNSHDSSATPSSVLCTPPNWAFTNTAIPCNPPDLATSAGKPRTPIASPLEAPPLIGNLPVIGGRSTCSGVTAQYLGAASAWRGGCVGWSATWHSLSV